MAILLAAGCGYVRAPRDSKVAVEFSKGKTRLEIGFHYNWLRNTKMKTRRKNCVKCTEKVLDFFRFKKIV